MYPVVSLIQLTLRVEREAEEAQRRTFQPTWVERAEETSASALKHASRPQRHGEPLCCQPEPVSG